MSKNDKQNRTDGKIISSGIEFPTPMKSFNNTTSDYSYTDASKIQSKNKTNQLK